jgi:Arc/MetJ-type ribon-helix-helix transcriptional regulator
MQASQVQVRVPEELLKEIDRWIAEKRFSSRSDAIRTIIAVYSEMEKTRQFYRMLSERSREAGEHPEMLIPLNKTA